MKRIIIPYAVCFSLIMATLTCFAQEQAEVTEPLDPIGSMIQTLVARQKSVAGQALMARGELIRFYGERNYAMAWNGADKDAKQLMKSIDTSSSHGLRPDLYHKHAIEVINDKIDDADAEQKQRLHAEKEVLMTDAFFTLAANLDSGLANPYISNANQSKPKSNTDLVLVLNDALADHNVADALERLAPATDKYKRLREALVKMQEVQAKGSWPTIPNGKKRKIEPGDTDPRVIAVRRRLEATGFIEPQIQSKAKTRAQINEEMMVTHAEPAENYYDEKLEQAVIRFQEKYGLKSDGVIGYRTIAMLNAQPDWRVCQIKINLDRMRAIDELTSSGRYAIVNIPDFDLTLVDGGKEIMNMKVIVGRLDRKSPLMSDEIRFLVFSPKWHVPTSIAIKDKLPKIKKDPSYIRRHGMTVYTAGPTGIERIEPEDVDWESVDANNFSYRIVQGTGDANALGRVKFMFPNRHAVYLHDTPTKYLFKRDRRTYSSGCIRIANPVGFAEYLLQDKEGWDRERIDASMRRATPLIVDLEKHLPIHILYLTAWADENSDPVFRQDVYSFDRRLANEFCEQ